MRSHTGYIPLSILALAAVAFPVAAQAPLPADSFEQVFGHAAQPESHESDPLEVAPAGLANPADTVSILADSDAAGPPARPEQVDAQVEASTDIESTPLPVPQQELLPLGSSPQSDAQGGAILGGAGWLRTVVALAGVIGLILGLRVLLVRVGKRSGLMGQLGAGGRAPSGVLSVLGRYPVSKGHTLVLLQVDRKVLLLNQTSAGFQTLTEIAEADDVASILMKTRDEEGISEAARFNRMLREMESDPQTAAEPVYSADDLSQRLGRIREMSA